MRTWNRQRCFCVFAQFRWNSRSRCRWAFVFKWNRIVLCIASRSGSEWFFSVLLENFALNDVPISEGIITPVFLSFYICVKFSTNFLKATGKGWLRGNCRYFSWTVRKVKKVSQGRRITTVKKQMTWQENCDYGKILAFNCQKMDNFVTFIVKHRNSDLVY